MNKEYIFNTIETLVSKPHYRIGDSLNLGKDLFITKLQNNVSINYIDDTEELVYEVTDGNSYLTLKLNFQNGNVTVSEV